MKKTISLSLVLVLLLAMFAVFSAEENNDPDITPGADDIFVATDGNDSNPGTQDSPLASFAAAKEKAKSVAGSEAVTVWFRGGTYYLDETVVFDETDRNNAVYSAYPDEEVVISGGKQITGWQTTEINGVTAWVADVPQGEDFMALYGKDGHLPTTFYPENSYFIGEPVSDPTSVGGDSTMSFYQLDKENMPEFISDDEVYIRILNSPWTEQINKIMSVDFESGIIRIDVGEKTMSYSGNGFRYRFENIKSMLKNPGQWYLDIAESKVYYVPQDGESIDGFSLTYGYLSALMTANKTDNISFRNIVFSDTRRDRTPRKIGQGCNGLYPSISFEESNGIIFDGCTVRNIGFNGIYFGLFCRDCAVKSCRFDSVGGTACSVSHSFKKKDIEFPENMTGNFTFTNNLVEHFSRVYQSGEGLLIGHCDGAEVSYNTIHDGYYTGISCGWVWGLAESPTNNIKVSHNLIYDIGQLALSDMGGIYTLGKQPGSSLTYNVIHNVSHCDFPHSGYYFDSESGYGGNGIFLDEGSSYLEINHNLIYDTTGGALAKHEEGAGLSITNNIFAFTGDFPFITDKVVNNMFISDKPETDFMYKSLATQGIDMGNYCFNYSGKYLNDCTFAEYYDEDPGFVDPAARDFSLKENASLYDFEKFDLWDFADVGSNLK